MMMTARRERRNEKNILRLFFRNEKEGLEKKLKGER